MRYNIIKGQEQIHMKTITATILCLIAVASAVAQYGGKAEPNRIEFRPNSTSTTLTGTLSNGQEMEYVFTARAGQTLTIVNGRNSVFDFRVFSDEFDVETEFESSQTFTMELPADGDYYFFVRKKATQPRRAKFSIAFSIK